METLKTTVETELQSTENKDIVLWAIDYKDAHDEMGFEVTVPQLIKMLLAFKKEFTDKDWYNAGIMAQRILQNDEIQNLKTSLKNGTKGHEHLVEHFKRQEEEIQLLRHQNEALQQRIVIILNKAHNDHDICVHPYSECVLSDTLNIHGEPCMKCSVCGDENIMKEKLPEIMQDDE